MKWEELTADEVQMLFAVGEVEVRKFRPPKHLIEDIRQDYWLRVMTNIKSFNRDKGKISTWAKQVVRSTYCRTITEQLQAGFTFWRSGRATEFKKKHRSRTEKATLVKNRPCPSGSQFEFSRYLSVVEGTSDEFD